MRRAYSRIQTELYPDTVFFLGDLFDGGREWSTRTTKSPEKQYQRYGDSYWLNEYRRFGDIFFKHWGDGGMQPRPGQPGRKLISSLPGNHDLGFAKGVQMGVRDRFHAYFGDGNRIDVVGNHSFVSIDSVSLSALGVPSSQELEALWKPTVDFLSSAKEQKRKLIQRELRIQQGLRPYPGFPHHEIPSQDLPHATLPHADSPITEFPSILLTHVPLYRAPGTPCGPLREHWPPTAPPAGQTEPLTHDDRNAISVSGGYQYQNVLNRDISADIASKVGDIAWAFSGDDHDYCELVHRGYASAGGGIHEITVKSISWAMGVRKPGFVLASLWNPVNGTGVPLHSHAGKTVQTHLCLLPDQIGVFIRYATLFGLTLILLCARAALVALDFLPPTNRPTSAGPLLPTTTASSSLPTGDEEKQGVGVSAASSSTAPAALLSRNPQARTRIASPANGYAYALNGNAYGQPAPLPHHQSSTYSLPLVQHAGYHDDSSAALKAGLDQGFDAEDKSAGKRGGGRKTRLGGFGVEVKGGLARVVVCGLGMYFWLVWRG